MEELEATSLEDEDPLEHVGEEADPPEETGRAPDEPDEGDEEDAS
jgi:hypothetical protein